MRIVVGLVAVLYVIAATYGYFWWNEHHQTATTASEAQTKATASVSAEQLRFPDVQTQLSEQLNPVQASVDNTTRDLEARIAQLELKQDQALKALQTQIDELKQQLKQTTSVALKPNVAARAAELPSDSTLSQLPSPDVSLTEAPVATAKKRLAATMSQLDLTLQADTPDAARQSLLQQKMEDAFNQAELSNTIQGRTECGQAFCKLDLQGKAPEGVDVLQVLWEQQLFPEATEVLTVPKTDGSGWLVYVATDGKSLPNSPE